MYILSQYFSLSVHVSVVPLYDICVYIREWTKEMSEALDSLEADLIAQVDVYITTTLKQWVVQEVSL